MFDNKQDIKNWLDSYNIKNYIVNNDLTVDVHGSVFLSNKNIVVLPLQFKKVKEHFICIECGLTSLKGCPEDIGKDFWCHTNPLKSLEFGPKIVGGSYECSNCELRTLDDLAEYIGGVILCKNSPFDNQLFNELSSEELKKYLKLNQFSVQLNSDLPYNSKDSKGIKL